MMHPAREVSYDELIAGLTVEQAERRVNTVTDGDLTLFNYSDKCVFDRCWTRFSLVARGLIVDTAARALVATPFPKFFNYGEGQAPGEPMAPLPDEPFVVSEKVDGSLGIIFYHGGRWRVATRGSFRSTQAGWAERWLNEHAILPALDQATTYLVEIVYSDNRIVIAYTYEGLVLLGAYDGSGRELTRAELEDTANAAGLQISEVYAYDSIDALLGVAKELKANAEGFVVRFESGRRIKIKGDEYVRLHRAMSHVTPLAVFELLIARDDLQKVALQLPDEFQREFVVIAGLLSAKFTALLQGVADASEQTKDMDDKTLGLWLRDQELFPDDVARWLFAVRKKDFFRAVHQATDLRRKVFMCFRPTANRLDGYRAAGSINRFFEEAA